MTRNRGRARTAPEALADAIEEFSDKEIVELWAGALPAARGSLYSWPRVFDELFCIYREVRSKYRRF